MHLQSDTKLMRLELFLVFVFCVQFERSHFRAKNDQRLCTHTRIFSSYFLQSPLKPKREEVADIAF